MNPAGETLYLAGSGVMAERSLGAGGVVQWTNYLSAGGEMVAMRVDRFDATTYTRYFHKDHLGSIATITDAAGAVVGRLSYDAWGKRRFPNGQDDPSGSIASQTTRGFTGHEQLADVGLIHMNGRVYDPMLSRFGTPDPMTEDPYNSQGWNRYTYVGNSPLNATDPSGYCWKGCFWQKPFKALGKLLRKVPIIGQILTVAAGIACAPFGLSAVCAGATSAVVTGLASGNLGLALKAGLISAVSAAAFDFAGQLTVGLEPLAKVAASAAVGCGSAALGGGKCGAGALSAGVSALAGQVLPEIGVQDNIVVRASIGGLASVAGGGKFGNGAVTAAFSYLITPRYGIDLEQGTEVVDWGGDFQKLNKIARDPVIATAIDIAWAASNPHDPYYGNRMEHGFYVLRDNLTGGLSTVNISTEGATYNEMPNWEPVPELNGKTTIAMFHTHPNSPNQRAPNSGLFFFTGPSSGDIHIAFSNRIGGIIRSHAGLHYYGWPEVK